MGTRDRRQVETHARTYVKRDKEAAASASAAAAGDTPDEGGGGARGPRPVSCQPCVFFSSLRQPLR